jgi:uncharacterized protein (DUF302 family)
MKDNFYYSKVVKTDFDTTVENARNYLMEEGFGIVSEINVQEKIKAGAGKEINKYIILGACNPNGAHRAIQIEEHIGVMLPCNVIVRETNDGSVEVAAVNPQQTIMSIGKKEMKPLADEIGEGLRKAVDRL